MDFSADTLEVQLDCYEGPLAALIALIKKEKVSIWDVPLSFITERFLTYIEIARELELKIAEDFIELASLLIMLKSRMLIPGNGDGAEGEELRENIIERLLEYEKVKGMVRSLDGLPVLDRDVFSVGARNIETPEETSLLVLCQAFFELLKNQDGSYLDIQDLRPTLEEKLEALRETLSQSPTWVWDYKKEESPLEKVATVIAMLELAKVRFATITQRRPFGSITLKRRNGQAE